MKIKINNTNQFLINDYINHVYALAVHHKDDNTLYYVGKSEITYYSLYPSIKDAVVFNNNIRDITSFIRAWFNSGTMFFVNMCKLNFNPMNVFVVDIVPQITQLINLEIEDET